jgi:hypothetical protein
MLSPYHLPLLIRYFDGIDLAISKRLLRRVPPSEPTLTEEFCALMDAHSQRRERSLEFDIDSLNAALGANGDLIEVDFSIETHQHAKWMEAYVSQADFALVLEFENMVLRDRSWHSAYLMQAKRLFPLPTESYGLASTFTSTDRDQQRRIRTLASILSDNAIRYCLYCPPTSGYEPNSAAAVRTLHSANLEEHIFDYSLGLALHDEIKRSGGVEAGMWIVSTQAEPRTAADLHAGAFERAHPLTWFLLQHFGERSRFGGIWKARRSSLSPQIDRVRAIARGDTAAIRALIDELGDDARKADLAPETRKVLPAATVTIRLRVGPEGMDMPISRDRST